MRRSSRDRKPSRRGAKFIASFEGFIPWPYRDSGGVWTIGFGHTAGVGPNSRRISRRKGIRLLRRDMKWAAEAVNGMVDVPLSRAEFDALCSFTFNVGAGGLSQSTTLRELNAGNRRPAADALKLWVKDAHGDVLEGLVRRRKAERRLFLHGYRGGNHA